MKNAFVAGGLLFLLFSAGLAAQEAAQEQPAPAPPLEDQISETQHSLRMGAQRVDYTARAGTMVLRNEQGEQKASVFFVSYFRNNIEDPGLRPLTFSFNGGPGSSSVWLHMGAFGPKRVLMQEEGHALPPPYGLVDNEHSLLDLTDLVFIDPPSTGYSRSAPSEDPKQFHGVEEDIEWVGEFIRLFTTRYERWGSPKFLAGESYGATRAAGLARHLQQRHGMNLNGVLLISSILNFQTARFDTGNDLPYPLFLPSYTAAAWYHSKLGSELQTNLRQALREAEEFALGEYAPALMQGSGLSAQDRQRIASAMSRLTGLSPAFIERSNLRVPLRRFVKELLRDERKTVGRLDSRFTGVDADAAGETFEYDPSYAVIQGPFTAVANDYLRTHLGFESELPYEVLTARVRPWNFGPAQNRYLNVAEDLR
ncbi:MAG TPA: peptidase S10, partial [Acidobacteriota bacterium]|nr:peptidase S10 [Acidobacteriota bacterium]